MAKPLEPHNQIRVMVLHGDGVLLDTKPYDEGQREPPMFRREHASEIFSALRTAAEQFPPEVQEQVRRELMARRELMVRAPLRGAPGSG